MRAESRRPVPRRRLLRWCPCAIIPSACRERITARWRVSRSFTTSWTPCWPARRSPRWRWIPTARSSSKSLREDYPQVAVLERPEHLRADTIPMNEVLLHDTAQIPGGSVPANPQHQPAAAPADHFARHPAPCSASYPAYDSLFSVTRLQTRLWDQLGRPINHNPAILLRTQDLPPVYEENSCMYSVHPPDPGAAPQPPGRAPAAV